MTIHRRTILASALAAASIAGAQAQERVELRLAHVLQPVAQAHIVATEVAQRVRDRTAGRVSITVFPAAQLGTTTEIIEQASQGQTVIGYGDAAYLSTFGVPELAALGGPFVVADNDEANRLAGSPLLDGWYKRLAEKAGIRVLALNWFDGARHVIGKKPYPKPADMKGVLIRVPPIPTWQKTFGPIGAVPTTVEAPEVYSALSQGVVEAAESPLVGMANFRWQEVAKAVTLTGHFNLFLGWSMSERVFQRIAPADQAVLIEEFRRGGEEVTRRNAALVGETRRRFEAAGVTFVEADIAAYREATKPFFASFPDWPPGLIDQIRAASAPR